MSSGPGKGFDESIVRIVNHLRHDMMNDMQVLVGYIQLNKQDKIKAYTQQMIAKYEQESRISKLGDDRLIAWLYGCRARHHGFEWRIVCDPSFNLAGLNERVDWLTNWLIRIAEASLASIISCGETGTIEIQFEMPTTHDENPSIRYIRLIYYGGYNEEHWLASVEPMLLIAQSLDGVHVQTSTDIHNFRIELQLTD